MTIKAIGLQSNIAVLAHNRLPSGVVKAFKISDLSFDCDNSVGDMYEYDNGVLSFVPDVDFFLTTDISAILSNLKEYYPSTETYGVVVQALASGGWELPKAENNLTDIWKSRKEFPMGDVLYTVADMDLPSNIRKNVLIDTDGHTLAEIVKDMTARTVVIAPVQSNYVPLHACIDILRSLSLRDNNLRGYSLEVKSNKNKK